MIAKASLSSCDCICTMLALKIENWAAFGGGGRLPPLDLRPDVQSDY